MSLTLVIFNVNELHTRNITVNEPHSGNSSVNELHTRSVTVSEPHSSSSSVSEPHTRNF